MMERLTRRNRDGEGEIPKVDLDTSYSSEVRLDYSEICALQEGINKLADYEDTEENGTLVRLPCKVGDTVYRFYERFVDGKIQILEKKISWIEVYSNNELVISVDGYPYSQRDFNKIFFFTREEAEKALKERSNE